MGCFVNHRKEPRTLAILFLGVFIYAIVAMAVSREVVIPRMMEESTSGHIAGDPLYYHSLALKKAAEIRAAGITEFELRPEGQGPAGVASLLYLIWENPYGVVLLNAFLHGLSAAVMMKILMQWFPRRTSIIATLPLAISPYMIVWFSQINKDTFALAGTLLFIYGLLKILGAEGKSLLRSDGLLLLLITVTGLLLIWIVRPYVNQILLPITGLILMIALSLRVWRGFYSGQWIGFAIYGAIVLACLGLLGKGAASDAILDNFDRIKWQSQAESQTVAAKCFVSIDQMNWRNEKFFPDFVNRKLAAMVGQRCLMFTILETHTNATTNYSFVEADKFPGGSVEALAYFPRAALHGVFSPWMDRWGYIFTNRPSAFYTIVPLEAAMLYFGLISLSVWLVRSNAWSALTPIALSVTVMTIYGLATPFIGALYRYRYPWWIMLICFGVAASFEVARRKSREG